MNNSGDTSKNSHSDYSRALLIARLPLTTSETRIRDTRMGFFVGAPVLHVYFNILYLRPYPSREFGAAPAQLSASAAARGAVRCMPVRRHWFHDDRQGHFCGGRGSNSSTQLPEGSSRRICLPPFPMTISLRKRAPALRKTSTFSLRSLTSI